MSITQWEIRRATAEQSCVHILICDDDPIFLERLGHALERIFAKLHRSAAIFPFHSPRELTPERLGEWDMAFLDIDFEGETQNGMDIARALRQVNRHVRILFVTNYIDYAPEGFEVQAFRYLLKRDMDQVLERYVLQALENIAQSKEFLRLRDKEQIFDLPLKQIEYLEVLDHYVSIHTPGEYYTLNATLSAMESAMAAHGFLRIHKSYLVNMAHIRKFRSRECLLSDGTALAVSEKYYSQQKQKFLLWKGLQG